MSYINFINQLVSDSFNKLMVVGGYIDNYRVEVVDLSGSLGNCPNLIDSPVDCCGVGVFIHGAPIVCDAESDTPVVILMCIMHHLE